MGGVIRSLGATLADILPVTQDYIGVVIRSPWSNTYEPPLEDGAMPSERLRKLELEANHAFDQYRDMYFEGGVSSVYLWDLDHGFAGSYLSEHFYIKLEMAVASC